MNSQLSKSSSPGPRIAELISRAAKGDLQESEKVELRAILDDSGFEPVFQIDVADALPVSGTANFCGVRYNFHRIPATQHWQQSSADTACFELRPLDADSGLVMHAQGTFRMVRALPAPLSSIPGPGSVEVRWTSFVCVELQGSPDLRDRFAEFLDRLASATATAAHWDAFIVTHYPDGAVENVRRDCARLLGDRPADSALSEEDQQRLRQWADRLRSVST